MSSQPPPPPTDERKTLLVIDDHVRHKFQLDPGINERIADLWSRLALKPPPSFVVPFHADTMASLLDRPTMHAGVDLGSPAGDRAVMALVPRTNGRTVVEDFGALARSLRAIGEEAKKTRVAVDDLSVIYSRATRDVAVREWSDFPFGHFPIPHFSQARRPNTRRARARLWGYIDPALLRPSAPAPVVDTTALTAPSATGWHHFKRRNRR
jgi:hypothetical protein